MTQKSIFFNFNEFIICLSSIFVNPFIESCINLPFFDTKSSSYPDYFSSKSAKDCYKGTRSLYL